MMESMAQTCTDSNRNGLEPSLNDLKASVERAAREGIAAHEGQAVRRLDTPHPRVYQSVFGRFELERVVYGTREGQKIAYVPFDTQLQLPDSDFSSLLQDWAQSVAVEHTY